MTGIMNPAVTHRTEGRHRLKSEDHKRIKIKRKEEKTRISY
jgi:hypothetical protein